MYLDTFGKNHIIKLKHFIFMRVQITKYIFFAENIFALQKGISTYVQFSHSKKGNLRRLRRRCQFFFRKVAAESCSPKLYSKTIPQSCGSSKLSYKMGSSGNTVSPLEGWYASGYSSGVCFRVCFA